MLSLGNKLTLNSAKPIYHFVNKYSIDFDGVDDCIVTDGADTVAQNTTYSFWCKTSVSGSNRVFAHGEQYMGGFWFRFATTPLLFLGTNFYIRFTNIPAQDDNEWHHWVVYLATNLVDSKLYCDGVLQAKTETISSGSLEPYTESLTIGGVKASGGDHFQGKIDEFAVYDRELTQAEITRMYNTYYTNNLVKNGNFEEIGGEEVTNGNFSQIGNEEVTNGDFSQVGSELLTNGDFSSGSGWNGSISVAGGQGTKTSSGLAYQIGVITSGKQYKIVVDVASLDGTTNIYTGGNSSAALTVGIQTIYMTGGSSNDFLGINNGYVTGVGSVFNSISVKEVGQDWSFLNAELTNSAVILGQADGSISQVGQESILTVGKTYKLSYDVLEDNSGSFSLSAPLIALTTTVGSHHMYFKATSTDLFIKRSSSSTTTKTTFTNISVKEVGQDWTFGTGWSTDGTKALFTATGSYSNLTQSGAIIGRTYKITFDATRSAGTLYVKAGSNGTFTAISSNGSYSISSVAAGDTNFYFQADTTFAGTVDNISVREVGQHWTFGSAWSTDGTKAIFDDSANSGVSQSVSFNTGSSYKITFDIVSGSPSLAFLSSNGATTYVTYSSYAVGTHSVTFDYTTGTGFMAYGSSILGGAFEIDNIVVQELKHQATNLLVNSGDYQSASPLITSTKSMEFDGVDDYLNAGVLPDVFKNAFTVSAWIWTDTNSGNHQIFSTGQGAFAQIYIVGGTGLRLVIQGGSGYSGTIANYFSSDYINKWIYFTITWDSANVKVYRNAIQVGSQSLTGTLDSITNEANIGRHVSNVEYWNGKITEFGLYDRGLTALEVASLYNQGMPTNLLVNRNNYQSGNPTVFNTKQVDFDGTDDYLNITNNYGSFTGSISAWVNRDDNTGYHYLFDSRGSSNGGVGFAYFHTGTDNIIVSSGTVYVDGVASTVAATDGNWHHIVITGISLNINENITIATRYSLNDNLDGDISQVGLWNSTLTADEVSSLYNHGLPIDLTTDQAAYESSSNLVGYWRMGSGTLDTYPLIADQTNATLGSDIVTNGDFADTSVWEQLSSSITISGGSANYDGSIATSNMRQTLTTVANKVYKVTYTISNFTQGTGAIRLDGNYGTYRTANGTYTDYITVSGTSSTFQLYGLSSFIGSFDNVSVKQVNGNPAMMINLGGGADFSDCLLYTSPSPRDS